MSDVDETVIKIFDTVKLLAKTSHLSTASLAYTQLMILLPKFANDVLSAVTPIPTKLRCAKCDAIHIDKGEWATKPHRTHLCEFCGHLWRPFPVPTVGVHMR